jgi:gluconolactonase
MVMHKKWFLCVLTPCMLLSCNNEDANKTPAANSLGYIEQLDSGLAAVLQPNAVIEKIAEGFEWSEGPVWVEQHAMLLFSDVPADKVYKWTEKNGLESYLSPSGYTGATPHTGEKGSNGLLLDAQGKLVLCQHGNRQVARMEAPLETPAPVFTNMAGVYNGKRLNSPNDAVFTANGDLYFTDPPYGLPKGGDADPAKELPFNGVYKLHRTGKLTLLIDSITRPNGIGLFPGEQQLIVANSDAEKPVWYVYDISGDSLSNGKIFYDASNTKATHGLPDGLKVDSKGTVFATGPGGIFIFTSKGLLLGKIHLKEAAANVALSKDEQTLFVTNDMYLLRIKLRN